MNTRIQKERKIQLHTAMVFSSFYDTELDEVSLTTAKKNVGETTESRNKGLQTLKIKLLSIDDLYPCLDDEFLLRYLRVAKFDVNKAFERVYKSYNVKKKYSYIFDRCYPSATKTAIPAKHFWASPKRTEDHSAVLFHKRGLFNPSTMSFDEMLLLDTVILNYIVENRVTQLCGATVILDFNGYGFRHIFADTPRRLRMALDTFQNSFPLRFKNIHVVNTPKLFTIMFNICYPFLSKKIKSRIHVHYNEDNWKSLHDLISPEILPEEYGGFIPNSGLIDLTEEVIKKDEFFKQQLQYGYIKKDGKGNFN